MSSQLQSVTISSLEKCLNESYPILDLMALNVPSELLKAECLLSTKFNDQWQGDQDLATIQTSSLEQYICLLVWESTFVHLSQLNLVIF